MNCRRYYSEIRGVSCGTTLLLTILCLGILFPRTAFSTDTPARIISFDPPGSTRTWVIGIDSAGLIVGFYIDSQGASHGFTRDAAGIIATFDAPGAGTGFEQGTYPEAVSNGGQICGVYADDQSHDHSFLLDSSGVFTTFDVSSATFASGVNDSETVAGDYYPDVYPYGYIGFVWTPNGMVTTFAPPEATYVERAEINSSGEITGWYESHSKLRGYYRDASGEITSFDASPSAGQTYPEAINDSGSIAGWFIDPAGWHGFVRAGTSITQFDVAGASITEGTSINASGKIAGWYSDANGAAHGFLRDKLGSVTVIDVSGAGKNMNQGTFATSTNAKGEVAGYFVGSQGNQHGFLRR